MSCHLDSRFTLNSSSDKQAVYRNKCPCQKKEGLNCVIEIHFLNPTRQVEIPLKIRIEGKLSYEPYLPVVFVFYLECVSSLFLFFVDLKYDHTEDIK